MRAVRAYLKADLTDRRAADQQADRLLDRRDAQRLRTTRKTLRHLHLIKD
jgi:hypothetical protein